MRLYDKYIESIANTYAWCLMPNHFHLLVRIKDNNEIIFNVNNTPERVSNPFGGDYNIHQITKYVTQQFSNLFNSYAQAFNKQQNRHGSLFEKPFKRKLIDHENYFQNVVRYIHNNPVHHGFCSHPIEWSWSSYLTCLSKKPTKLKRESVLEWFGDIENFKCLHDKEPEVRQMDKWLGL